MQFLLFGTWQMVESNKSTIDCRLDSYSFGVVLYWTKAEDILVQFFNILAALYN